MKIFAGDKMIKFRILITRIHTSQKAKKVVSTNVSIVLDMPENA